MLLFGVEGSMMIIIIMIRQKLQRRNCECVGFCLFAYAPFKFNTLPSEDEEEATAHTLRPPNNFCVLNSDNFSSASYMA